MVLKIVSDSTKTTRHLCDNGHNCGLFRFRDPREPHLGNVNSCTQLSYIVRLNVLKSKKI